MIPLPAAYVFPLVSFVCLVATGFQATWADENALPDSAIVFVAPETTIQRDLRFIRGLLDLGLYDLAATEATKLVTRSGEHPEKNVSERANASIEAVSLAMKATAALWTLVDGERRVSLEKEIIGLRRTVEGEQASSLVFVWPENGDEPVRLRYAAAILEYQTARATVLRCQNKISEAGGFLQPLVAFIAAKPAVSAYEPDEVGVETLRVERCMEYLFALERFREEAVLCGVVRRDFLPKVLPEFARGLTRAESALFDPFVKYLDLRAARFDDRREDSTACLASLMSMAASRYASGIEAERLRLAVLGDKAHEMYATDPDGFDKEAPFMPPIHDDMLTKILHDDRQLARFEFLLAIGKEKHSDGSVQRRITRQLEVVKSSCSPVVACQAESLLGASGQSSTDAGMTETAAESAWRAGRIDEAVSLYDAASRQAMTANQRADAFRLAAAAAAILKQRLNSDLTPDAPAKSDTAARLDLLNRFTRLGRDFPDEKHAGDFLAAGLDLAVSLLKSGNISFDDYLKLRIEFLLRGPDTAQREDFRFRTIALAFGNHRVEPAILLLKENPACSQVPQAILALVAEGMKRVLFDEEPLPTSVSSREVADLFLLWNNELKKPRSVPLLWNDSQSRTLELCRAQALFLTGHVTEAFKLFATMFKAEPNDQNVLLSLATILSQRTTDAEIDRAIELWSRIAAENASGSARATLAREQLVLLLKRRGRNDQADKLKRLIELEKGEQK